MDLADFRQFQDCLGETPISQPCRVHDTNADESVTSADYPFFERLLDGPQ